MALTWPQFSPNLVILHNFSDVLATLFSENLDHFKNLKAKMWHKWSKPTYIICVDLFESTFFQQKNSQTCP